jgi:hypothetical protein
VKDVAAPVPVEADQDLHFTPIVEVHGIFLPAVVEAGIAAAGAREDLEGREAYVDRVLDVLGPDRGGFCPSFPCIFMRRSHMLWSPFAPDRRRCGRVAGSGLGLCGILDLDFGELPFHALR